eukprot:9491232-Pyramimonas_sp.AAC.4
MTAHFPVAGGRTTTASGGSGFRLPLHQPSITQHSRASSEGTPSIISGAKKDLHHPTHTMHKSQYRMHPLAAHQLHPKVAPQPKLLLFYASVHVSSLTGCTHTAHTPITAVSGHLIQSCARVHYRSAGGGHAQATAVVGGGGGYSSQPSCIDSMFPSTPHQHGSQHGSQGQGWGSQPPLGSGQEWSAYPGGSQDDTMSLSQPLQHQHHSTATNRRSLTMDRSKDYYSNAEQHSKDRYSSLWDSQVGLAIILRTSAACEIDSRENSSVNPLSDCGCAHYELQPKLAVARLENKPSRSKAAGNVRDVPPYLLDRIARQATTD